MKNKRVKGFISVLLMATLCFFSVGYNTQAADKLIRATYDNTKIYLDKLRLVLEDEDGKEFKPVIIDGEIYLPVRLIASAVGKEVNWNRKTKKMYLTTPTSSNSVESEDLIIENKKEKEQSVSKQAILPVYQTDETVYTFTDFMKYTYTYTKYQSDNVLYDLLSNKGVFASSYWETLFLIMGYDYEMIQQSMELWKDHNGYYNYRKPNGSILSADGVFAAYIVQAYANPQFKDKYFYAEPSQTIDLKSYLLINGNEDVKAYINGKYEEDIDRQKRRDEYWEKKDWSINYY
ncbi:MAG: stalk domain-containing protein [Mobilitalea sp.]